MTEQAQAPVRLKPCDGCGNRVTLQERRADTGLCHPCNKAAVDFFGITEQQAGMAVLAKKIAQHFKAGDSWEGQSMRHRVRSMVLATEGTIPNATVVEQADAITLRDRYAFLGRNKSPIKPEPQTDFLEGMP